MTVLDSSVLTVAERVALIESDWLTVDAGCVLLDADDVFIEDISDDLIVNGSAVSRGIYRTVHGSCRLNLSRDIQWGSQRLQPYLLLSSDGVTFYRWNLGVFLPSTPVRDVFESPAVWSVDGFDKLDVLNTPHGRSHSIDVGEPILANVEALIVAAGESKVAIDQTSADVTATTPRAFTLLDDWMTLGIANEALSSLGYRALYVDRDGWYRSEPYRAPVDLPKVWTYSASSPSTTVGERRTVTADYYDAANQIVGVNDDASLTIPVEGNGIRTVTNQSDGLTSVDARGGRIIRRVVRGTYTSQASLMTAVDSALDTEKRVANFLDFTTSPNPVHGHFDVIDYIDPEAGGGRFVVTDWSLPLDGGDMQLNLRGV